MIQSANSLAVLKNSLPRGARAFALLISVMLAGCIDSAQPIFTDAQPSLGEHLTLRLYNLHDGKAHEPDTETVRWQEGRYVPTGGTIKINEFGAFSLHAFVDPDLIVQSTRPDKPTEYAVAHKLADGTYLLSAVDETDADDATRRKYCYSDAVTACRVDSREAVLALAHATAAKPHSTGGLVLILAGD